MGVASALSAVRSRGGSVALALAGAAGFLTRVPIGHRRAAWEATTRSPASMVAVAYPIGAALALVLALGLPPATIAIVLPAWVIVLTGVTHLDGAADVGDAAVVHGDVGRRRAVLLDTEVGVGAVAAVVLVLAGLALAGLALSSVPLATAASLLLAAEVGAKLGMVALAGVGPPLWGELGSQMGGTTPLSVAAGTLLAVPAVALPGVLVGSTAGAAAATAVLAGLVAALAVGTWAQHRLDGANGDCFGATNELARVLALHLGLAVATAGTSTAADPSLALEVMAWTLS